MEETFSEMDSWNTRPKRAVGFIICSRKWVWVCLCGKSSFGIHHTEEKAP